MSEFGIHPYLHYTGIFRYNNKTFWSTQISNNNYARIILISHILTNALLTKHPYRFQGIYAIASSLQLPAIQIIFLILRQRIDFNAPGSKPSA